MIGAGVTAATNLSNAFAARVNPFNLRTILLAKHAQHVVLVHFPIALFIAGVAFDLWPARTKRTAWADAAFYNLSFAAVSVIPVVLTGILAWQFALEGQRLKGVLLLHLLMGSLSAAAIAAVWLVHFLARRQARPLPRYRIGLEMFGVLLVALTGHLGGFLSGVSGGS